MYMRYNTLRDKKEAGRRACPTHFRRVFTMKFFEDTANAEDIKKANDMGVICGVTTNPSLIAKEGRNFAEVIKEITDIVDGPISGEVKATTVDAEGMIKEGREIAAIHPEYGMTIPYPDEVSIKRQLIQSSRRVIALVNPIKLNTVSRYHVCGIEAFTTLITDNGVSGEMAVDYRNKGLDFL